MARAFATEGMNIVVADIDTSAAAATAADVKRIGTRSVAVPTDVTDPVSTQALADVAYREFGAVHVLCLNAGVSVMKPFVELTRADWDRVLSVQFYGVLNGILAFLPHLL